MLVSFQDLEKGIATWGIMLTNWRAVISQSIFSNTIPEYPIVEEYSFKICVCTFPSGNWTGEFWILVGHNRYMLATQSCFRKRSQYSICYKPQWSSSWDQLKLTFMLYLRSSFWHMSGILPELSVRRLQYAAKRNDDSYCRTYVITLGVRLKSDNEREIVYRCGARLGRTSAVLRSLLLVVPKTSQSYDKCNVGSPIVQAAAWHSRCEA